MSNKKSSLLWGCTVFYPLLALVMSNYSATIIRLLNWTKIINNTELALLANYFTWIVFFLGGVLAITAMDAGIKSKVLRIFLYVVFGYIAVIALDLFIVCGLMTSIRSCNL